MEQDEGKDIVAPSTIHLWHLSRRYNLSVTVQATAIPTIHKQTTTHSFLNGNPRYPRTPRLSTTHNTADQIERLMQTDGFRKWGFVIYRCTYANDSDWDAFMARIYGAVKEYLEYSNGMDILDSFAPTVVQDWAAFEGATTAVVREHFVNTWVLGVFPEENPDLDIDIPRNAESGRYRFFIMVDEESLRPVLEVEEDSINHPGFVRLVQADWGSKRSNIVDEEKEEEEFAPVPGWDECEPLEGCVLQDVGWMNILYDHVEAMGYPNIRMYWGTGRTITVGRPRLCGSSWSLLRSDNASSVLPSKNPKAVVKAAPPEAGYVVPADL
ncbi:hypothetical protein ASPVEDRAFT_25186 [Aspergillus versicolor CBS 583.65]|uniref:Uncharacterized protein n=1 Tax=Aspergillus versicolor CBS 583.65 TaxID=1036611 RepID=A0A1L9PA17_ASPVE|nr:uncharacterized protein ASPVEDRAFT_25186 [Aspergillus versicolor CBS 583.65]OJI98294.1 hypothetical protein ASPVEDRAFT_25186 [Aspergillus versicolor CBS 583.65]